MCRGNAGGEERVAAHGAHTRLHDVVCVRAPPAAPASARKSKNINRAVEGSSCHTVTVHTPHTATHILGVKPSGRLRSHTQQQQQQRECAEAFQTQARFLTRPGRRLSWAGRPRCFNAPLTCTDPHTPPPTPIHPSQIDAHRRTPARPPHKGSRASIRQPIGDRWQKPAPRPPFTQSARPPR